MFYTNSGSHQSSFKCITRYFDCYKCRSRNVQLEEIEQIIVEHVALVQQKESEKQNRKVKVALVINANKAYYFEQDKEPTLNSIPSGGVLLDVEGKIIAKNTEHYNQL